MIISLFLLTFMVNAFILSLMVIQCCHLALTSQGSNKTYCISVIQLTNCSFLVKVWWTEKINYIILQICWRSSNKFVSYILLLDTPIVEGYVYIEALLHHCTFPHSPFININQRLSHISISFTGNLSLTYIQPINRVQREHIFNCVSWNIKSTISTQLIHIDKVSLA